MAYQITNQRELRCVFWETTAEGKRGAKNRFGEYSTDTRIAFCDFIDRLARDGIISEALAQRATLE